MLCAETDDPLPPVSWTSKPPSEAESKSKGSRKGKVRRRSKSVGANVVELAKKHWKGRPTTRETTPKIPYNDRLIMKPMVGRPPTADEYQTADGVPFPRKTAVWEHSLDVDLFFFCIFIPTCVS